jgi:hypothetical protein
MLHGLIRIVEEQVDETAKHADAGGEQEVIGLFAEPDFFTDAKETLPVSAKELRQLPHSFRVSQKLHAPIYNPFAI